MQLDDVVLQESDLNSVVPLRFAILRPGEQDSSRCRYPGDDEPSAVHLRLMREGSAIGMVSILPDVRELILGQPATVSRIRALGVLPSYQGVGLGRWTLARAIEVAADASLLPTWGSGRSHLKDFYNSLGAITVSEPYEIDGTGEHLDFYIPIS